MNSLSTYPIQSQPTVWLSRAGMRLCSACVTKRGLRRSGSGYGYAIRSSVRVSRAAYPVCLGDLCDSTNGRENSINGVNRAEQDLFKEANR